MSDQDLPPGAGVGAPVRHGRLPRRDGAWPIIRFIAGGLAVVAVSIVGVAGISALQLASRLGPSIELPSAGEAPPPTLGAIEGPVNFLLVGNDSGGGNPVYGQRDAQLNDVTVLVHLAADHSNATIVTFPRDLYVSIPECSGADGETFESASLQKINTAYSHGGVPCVAETVTELTGVQIDYAADVDFDGAIAVAEAIGGVDVCLASPLRDKYTNPPLDLPAGTVTLEGATAVSFLRSRYGVGDGSDLGRVSNQQLFFAALARQTRDKLSDLPTVYRIAQAAASNMSLSSNLQNPLTLASIALAFRDIDFSKIVFVQYPNHYPEPGERQVNGVLPTVAAAQVLNDALVSDTPVVLTDRPSGSGATVPDPAAPRPEPDPIPSPSPTPSPSASSSASPSPSPSASPKDQPVELPSNTFGQTAADLTCSSK
ncbi:LCP family protein [Salinibacterium hongtaonis]|uniref:LCP family protein n=1 Tax=Homoserinimonas hongtaonis TaxID=2079791 RepID=UPI000D3587DC|nr:LCP family protein [Salinibacterium hongtaonis]AWB89182.1 hypothetical protein C2138_06195 [Salinibacterium hongtaonis]